MMPSADDFRPHSNAHAKRSAVLLSAYGSTARSDDELRSLRRQMVKGGGFQIAELFANRWLVRSTLVAAGFPNAVVVGSVVLTC